jgi:hypothetical protein
MLPLHVIRGERLLILFYAFPHNLKIDPKEDEDVQIFTEARRDHNFISLDSSAMRPDYAPGAGRSASRSPG